MHSRARAAASAVGCANTRIDFNDPRVVPGYGAYDSDTRTILINPAAVNHRLEWVVTHECMHDRQARIYGSWYVASNELGGVARGERITDLMTILAGGNPAHAFYTSNGTDAEWAAARALMNGQKP